MNTYNHQLLIIDGNKKDAKDLASILQGEGYQTHAVPTREQGLSEIDENPITLVVLDHENLSDSGIEIIQEIAESDPFLQLIILSRDKSFDSAIKALRSRASDYILKPYRAEDILDAIKLALENRTKQLLRSQYYDQMDYLWARIKHLDMEGVYEDKRGEFKARFFSISQSTKVDLERQAILHNDKTVPLTESDLSLLFVFLNNPRQILTYQDIFMMKEGVELPVEKAKSKLPPMVHRLRLRLSEIPGAEEWIETVRGTGYIFNI
jgi:DNA-binding response OmpR family regulator